MNRVAAFIAGILGVVAVVGLIVIGLAAAAILVPAAIVAFLVVRRRLRARVAAMEADAWRASSADIEGVVIDVRVEQPDDGPASRPALGGGVAAR
ncbi:MAG: hypothetical protein FJX36_15450 [Alphaproteobacteria bacterium]|nr:hypothetical protein [Alphaproteobacteria bacterium]